MAHITSTSEGPLAVIQLASGKANALNSAMVDELIGATAAAAQNDGVRGIVLASGRPRFFSAGFDVREIFQYDRQAMAAFFGRFIDLYEQIVRIPKPVVAAINGHAVAGGAVLALTADRRVWAEGEFQFALNEVNLGIVMTPGVIHMATAAMGAQAASELLLAGTAITPQRALQLGLAHELAPPEQVLEHAMERARELAGKPPSAFAAVKRLLHHASSVETHTSDRATLDQFLDHWFSQEAQHARDALVQSMRQ